MNQILGGTTSALHAWHCDMLGYRVNMNSIAWPSLVSVAERCEAGGPVVERGCVSAFCSCKGDHFVQLLYTRDSKQREPIHDTCDDCMPRKSQRVLSILFFVAEAEGS